MSSLKKSLMKRGMKLMSDPRVLKLMQDERVMKAVMQMMAVPGKVQSFTHEQIERLAKSMALATEDEMKDLKRTVRRLEEEIARMKQADRRERDRAAEERPSTRSVSGASGAGAKKKATSAE
jgi:cell division protein FtsB